MSPVEILLQITLPIFVMIGIGVIVDRTFEIDLRTLTRIVFYVFSPAIVFDTIVRSDLVLSELLSIGLFAALHAVVMFVLGFALFSARPFQNRRTILTMGSVFINSGNYGFPLMLLAFGEYGLSVIAVVLMTQVVILNSGGLLYFLGDRSTLRQSIGQAIKLPVLYALILGFIARAVHLTLPDFLSVPLNEFVDGYIALALMTLGVQLSRSEVVGDMLPMLGIVSIRLLISPLVAVVLTALLRFPWDLSMMLIVGAGLPVAVNVFVLATEFDRNPSFASRMVFWTTLLTAITIPLLLLIVQAVR